MIAHVMERGVRPRLTHLPARQGQREVRLVVGSELLLDAGSLALLAGIFHRMGSLRADVKALRTRLNHLEQRVKGVDQPSHD